MFSLFRRSKAAAEDTFKTRVDRFWHWYSSASRQLLDAIDAKQLDALAGEVSEQVDRLGGGFAWVFGPGEHGARHSFTLSGEGIIERQILAQYWQQRAPKLEGWSFHSSRQPSPKPGEWRIEMYGEKFDPIAFWASVFVDEQNEKFDITVWHPLFAKLPEPDRYRILFIMLDEMFGEFGTQRWLGEIKMSDARLAEAMPLLELRSFVAAETARHGWKLLPPGESTSFFEVKRPSDFPRGDSKTWITVIPSLVAEYFKTGGRPEDPVKGTGASFLFVSLPASMFARGAEIETRARVEDALNAALGEAATGRLIGAAMAASGAYIDLLTYDGERSIDLIKQTLRKLGLPKGVALRRLSDAGGRPLFEI